MLKHEFESLTGVEIGDAEFEKINELYMAAGDMDKETFCADWKKHKHSKLLAYFSGACRDYREAIGFAKLMRRLTVQFLLGKSRAYNDPDMRREAVRLASEKEVVLVTLEEGLPLWEEDIKFIKEHLK